MIDRRGVFGGIFIGVVILVVGILTIVALSPDYMTKEESEIERKKCLEQENMYFTLTRDIDDNILSVDCKFNLNIGNGLSPDQIQIEKLDLIIEKLNSGRYYIDQSETNVDIQIINEAIDCYNRKGTFSFEFHENGVFKDWSCTHWYDGRDP